MSKKYVIRIIIKSSNLDQNRIILAINVIKYQYSIGLEV